MPLGLHVVLGAQHYVDLTHQLVAQADPELLDAHLRQGAEMQLAGRGDDAVDHADLAKEALDAGRVGAVDAILAARRAHFDDFMARFQCCAHCLADRAGCADHDDLFHLLLRLVLDVQSIVSAFGGRK
jgi:hypothetical protein